MKHHTGKYRHFLIRDIKNQDDCYKVVGDLDLIKDKLSKKPAIDLSVDFLNESKSYTVRFDVSPYEDTGPDTKQDNRDDALGIVISNIIKHKIDCKYDV